MAATPGSMEAESTKNREKSNVSKVAIMKVNLSYLRRKNKWEDP
jgi:hypothetical protein